jgi:predicted transcriptional regulator
MTSDDNLIKFTAQVSKVTTMADGSLRVVLDFSEKDIDVATKLMQVKQAGAVLEIVAVPVHILQ